MPDTPEASSLPVSNTPLFAANEKIDKINVADEIKNSFLDYSMSVIISRALPDVRDGLKPSQRRLLFAMFNDLNLLPTRKHLKCARIVGETMGKYHPHGDQAIYPTLVHMAQPWAMRDTLVDGQGNFGSVEDDPPAAMRYTEARLTHLAYAPEIAQSMLRRQQAEAVIAARQKIVQGAVSMVDMALKELSEKRVVELDDDRRAAMVSNLMVVLCGESEVHPVVNTGTLYA